MKAGELLQAAQDGHLGQFLRHFCEGDEGQTGRNGVLLQGVKHTSIRAGNASYYARGISADKVDLNVRGQHWHPGNVLRDHPMRAEGEALQAGEVPAMHTHMRHIELIEDGRNVTYLREHGKLGVGVVPEVIEQHDTVAGSG